MWSVIETLNRATGWELSVVPNTWLGKKGNYVRWPTSKSSEEQVKLSQDPNSKPQSSWPQIQCRMKHQNISTFDRADALVDAMSGESASSDFCFAPKAKRDKIVNNTFQRMMTCDPLAPPTPSSSHQESVFRSPYVSRSAVPSDTPKDSPEHEIRHVAVRRDSVVDSVDGSISPTTAKLVVRELSQIKTQLASQQVTLDLLLNINKNSAHGADNYGRPSIDFDKVENKFQLAQLNKRLEDEYYKRKLVIYLYILGFFLENNIL